MACFLASKPWTIIDVAIFQIDVLSAWALKNKLLYNVIKLLVSKHIILKTNNNDNIILFFK